MQIRSIAYKEASIKDGYGKSPQYYEHMVKDLEYKNACDFMQDFQRAWKEVSLQLSEQSRKVLHGKLFEFAISECLAQECIPHCYQHKLGSRILDLWVPNKPIPVLLSCKTTLRDRFDIAMAEAAYVKAEVPEAMAYLLTEERHHQQWSYKRKDVIDRIVCVTGTFFVRLLDQLRQPVINGHGGMPPKLPTIVGQQRINIK